ncbi:MAG: cytochrome b [Geminicoccaceae bacterium]|nr:cytochrome b [Geminicoccaceae bacterium]MDW8124929.1 cytochrome b [Geminicoccaceae bacterium]
MSWRSDRERWGLGIRLFHWVTALLVLGQWLLGRYMVGLGPEALTEKFVLYQRHKSLGLVILALTLLRLVWRLLEPARPAHPPTMPLWQRRAAAVNHALLYLLLLAMPITGFLAAAASPLGIPTLLFGVIPIPHPIGPDARLEAFLLGLHQFEGWVLAALLALHVGAALKHHLIDRDRVLVRMIGGR